MNKTRIMVRCFAGAIATTALVVGSLGAPAQAAKRDTGWGVAHEDSIIKMKAADTGWG